MPVLTILRGLPASGKSTLATKLCLESPLTARVNRDTLRTMLVLERNRDLRETIAEKLRDLTILNLLTNGLHVVVDDTNLTTFNVDRLKGMAQAAGALSRVVELSVPIDLCVVRDFNREYPVGDAAIQRLYATYQPAPPVYAIVTPYRDEPYCPQCEQVLNLARQECVCRCSA